jgi:hypothetical protein
VQAFQEFDEAGRLSLAASYPPLRCGKDVCHLQWP